MLLGLAMQRLANDRRDLDARTLQDANGLFVGLRQPDIEQ